MNIRKLYTPFGIALLGIFTAQCSSSDNKEIVEIPEETYTTYTYYSYDAEKQLSATDFGFEADAFTPYTINHIGDTLFVANTGSAGNSLIAYDMKNGRNICNISSWQMNGEEKKFNSAIEGITVSGNHLYVTERESRIHVFSLPDLKYISCIGNGSWAGEVFQSQAIFANDSLLFSRDKNSVVSIYRLSDATAENYQNVRRWKQAAGIGMSNNAFKAHDMTLDEDGYLLLTDYEGKIIRALNIAKVSNDMKNGESIDDSEKSIVTDFKPLSLALTKQFLFIIGVDNMIHVYNREKKSWNNEISTVNGFDFGQPASIDAVNDSTLYVSDMKSGKNVVVRLVMHKHEIREW